ncbi:Glycosyl transferase family 2 [Gemmata obscuriglobus]|uniref:Glycosyltransferase 2-like domain-containing protein n=1 Tax=Gemmata obscuriglobus TaxID=114 RepID=A0A2Z3H8T1_9BACT|nr:glycosyltransferase [Gemmata obscuriglobus]AWM38124.1 hypothetical protein C1280_14725 [Gemmata obscuriglobus]QEG28993.1 Glycosyl transferase family 2 [Gemmata obscuriglobus]VTS07561.1 Uncharacterized protein OS=Hyphomicrobium sp. (strain MC1) GN=HYPMC_1479 PE=4 SV=1: Glycos_transf_2 [Gemmata obscuriglobus UQM 2246]
MSSPLTIGMATRGEPDHVWFVLSALAANHPRVEYLVVDNTPERDPRVEAITRAVGGRYLHRPDLTGTSKPRDAVFRFARTPWAVCLDSHVILETGAVQAALDFAARNPDSRDIVSGPLVYDDGRGLSTHWKTNPGGGLWGTWDTDPRGADPAGEPFEIPMMGLGLWLMRTAAWPGFHPLFNGFGGEEGYVHEVVRRRGGRALCVPGLRWRHKFRDVSGWHNNPPPPYPLRTEDHVWNLLVGHRELGIEADQQIREHFGKNLGADTWDRLVKTAAHVQPLDGPRPGPTRQRILALWYSDNSAPDPLLMRSLQSVIDAREQTIRHDVTVSACAWEIGGNLGILPSVNTPGIMLRSFIGARKRGYNTILAQIRQAVAHATASGEEYDAVAFCEHDVLYPPGYFDRLGDALAAHPSAPVVSHRDYIGLSGTGWQRVRERHEPLHQLCLRWDTIQSNLARAEREAASGAAVVLEPDHEADRSAWARLEPADPAGMSGTPSVHVNHNAGRFTAHGDVCYEPRGASLWHPHWGEARHWWPGPMVTVSNVDVTQFKPEKPAGCSACEANAHPTPEAWARAAAAKPSDFHEHVGTLRELAAKCSSAAELSLWMKPADAAIVAGLPADGTFVSVCPRAKPQWERMKGWLGARFEGRTADPATADLPPVDLLFIDTEHTADALMPLLERHRERVAKYIAVHCTETFGESGDRPDAPGVLHALRTFCHRHPGWVVKRRDRNNHGLIVLSRCAEDVRAKPALWRQAMNYTAAMARHVADGRRTVPLDVLEARQAECALCEERALDACAACGCPLEAKLPLATESCGLVKKGQAPKWGAWPAGAAA